MPVLANDRLRLDNLKDYLDSIRLSLPDGVSMTLSGEQFYFEGGSEEDLAAFSKKLLTAFSKKETAEAVSILSFDTLVTQTVQAGTHLDASQEDTYRQTASALLPIILQTASGVDFDKKSLQGTLSMLKGMSGPLKQLTYKNLSFTYDDKLTLDLRGFINAETSPVVLLKLSDKQAPLVCLKSQVLSNRIFYKVSDVETDKTKVEVTPYFIVPRNIIPPEYHFVLDISTSMGGSIGTLKEAVKKMAGFIFEFEPNASISISTFASETKCLGRYKCDTLWKLNRDVGTLSASGSTVLYRAAAEEIEKLQREQKTHHNVLLFTDGEDQSYYSSSDARALDTLNKKIAEDKALCAHNKFYVINYNKTEQVASIKQVVANFDSSVINAESADFIRALQDKKEMQRFAATRELFSCRLSIANQKEGEMTELTEMSFDQSGQLVALPKITVLKGSHIKTEVKDASDRVVAGSEMTLPPLQKLESQVAAVLRNQSPVFGPEPKQQVTQPSKEEPKGLTKLGTA